MGRVEHHNRKIIEKEGFEHRFDTANAIFNRDYDGFVKSLDNLVFVERSALLSVLCKDRDFEFVVLLVRHWSFDGNRVPIRDQVIEAIKSDDVEAVLALLSVPWEMNLGYRNGQLFDLVRSCEAKKTADLFQTLLDISC